MSHPTDCAACARFTLQANALQADMNADTERAAALRRIHGDRKDLGSSDNPGFYENRAKERRRQLQGVERKRAEHLAAQP